jgi:chloramphenicol 3-O-phosphotransferase
MTVIEANNVAEWNTALRAAKAQGKTVIVDAYAVSHHVLRLALRLSSNSDTSTNLDPRLSSHLSIPSQNSR